MNIIVTGGSRGIGKCLVENLARDGHNVLLNYNKSEKEALLIQSELANKNIQIDIFKADVSNHYEVTKLINFCDNILACAMFFMYLMRLVHQLLSNRTFTLVVV